MKNDCKKYEAPVVEMLEVRIERVCYSPEDNGVKRNDYEGEDW